MKPLKLEGRDFLGPGCHPLCELELGRSAPQSVAGREGSALPCVTKAYKCAISASVYPPLLPKLPLCLCQ